MKTYRFASPSLKRAALPEKIRATLVLPPADSGEPPAPCTARHLAQRHALHVENTTPDRSPLSPYLPCCGQVVPVLLMPRKFRKGRLDKSGTGSNKHKPAARLIVRPGERRALHLQRLQDEGENCAAGASPRAFVEVVCCGLVLCPRAQRAMRGGALRLCMLSGRPGHLGHIEQSPW